MEHLQNDMKKAVGTIKTQRVIRWIEVILTGIVDVLVASIILFVFSLVAGSGIGSLSQDPSGIGTIMKIIFAFTGFGLIAVIMLLAGFIVINTVILIGCISSIKSSSKIVSNYKLNAWNQGWDYQKDISRDVKEKLITSIIFMVACLIGMIGYLANDFVLGIIFVIPFFMELIILITSCINLSKAKSL